MVDLKQRKKEVLTKFLEHFEKEMSALVASAKAAHQAATHEESRAEDRHDTFAIEASYLAAGQATRVNELEKCVQEFRQYLEDLHVHQLIQLGSLIKIRNIKEQEVLIALHGGGAQVDVQDRLLSVMSPNSPMGEELMGFSAGDEFSLETKAGTRTVQIIEVS